MDQHIQVSMHRSTDAVINGTLLGMRLLHFSFIYVFHCYLILQCKREAGMEFYLLKTVTAVIEPVAI